MADKRDAPPTERSTKHHAQETAKWNRYYRDLPDVEEDAALRGFNVEFVEIVRLLLPFGGSTLEAGSGGGWQSLALARAGFDTTLTDVSAEALSYAKRTFARHEEQATFTKESVFDPGDARFDLVFNLGALEHYDLEDQARFVRGMAERSRRFVIVMVPNRYCYWYWLWRIWRTEADQWPFGREIPTWNLEDIFKLAGVRLVGHQWLGSTWTEGLLSEIPGLSSELRSRVLRVHRSSLIPAQQRCYLIAALGTTTKIDRPIPGGWKDLGSSPANADVAKLAAELAEELAKTGALIDELGKVSDDSTPIRLDRTYREALENSREKVASLESLLEVNSQLEMLKEILPGELANWNVHVRETLDQNKLLERSLEEKGQQLADLAVENVKLREELRELRDLEQRHRSQIAGIHASRLWRLGHGYWELRRRLLAIFHRMRDQAGELVRRLIALSSSEDDRGELWDTEDHSRIIELPGFDILMLPIIDWDFRFQRPQQLARRFAQDNHRVFYLKTTFQSEVEGLECSVIEPGIYGLQLNGKSGLSIYKHCASTDRLEEWLGTLTQLRHRVSIEQAVLMVQLPFWGPLAFAARERWGWKVVYDCMDAHDSFTTNEGAMLALEERLIRSADLVVASSQILYAKVSSQARSAVLVRNAADFDHFHSAPNDENASNERDRPVIGYYGAISDWFDVGLIEEAASARPEWQFILIGSTFGADVSSLKRLPNVDLLGERPYEELPAQLRRFDVALLPFKRTPLTEASNPVKFYEYLAAGKPVVAVDLPELAEYKHLFYPVSEAAEFVPQIETALAESESMRSARYEIAQRNTWQARYDEMKQSVDGLFGKATVVIVSYNNPKYLKLCLESVWAKTVYPNYEVVVVDNGSAIEVREYLLAEEQREEQLKVIFNAENVGFPCANNIGIQAARNPDFIVLLNDDTVVTRGWLSRLLRYLDDPAIELIGPITNWCGNEACIEVDYESIDGLEDFARRYTANHEGECTDLRVLAMFCIAMRKELLDRIGLLDERFGVGMFEDDDFCRRVLESGGRVVCAEDVFVHHWGRSSFGRMSEADYGKLFRENRKKYEEKWGHPWIPHRFREHRS